eukprot:TRINITY_DN32045_c0_g1_i1.p1 TRINITY_DN32045_c0_g1~~TRINITY_DN32045_c0_g1_i1.p1  ORF type:complete len:1807 (+),score=793.59 TRINITY_DN32045_c0_g1_i1:69-5489(+)
MTAIDAGTVGAPAPMDPLKKRKAQNDAAITEYEHRIRKQSIDYESKLMELCSELKKELVLSAGHIEKHANEQYERLIYKVSSGIIFKEQLLDEDDTTFESVTGPCGLRQNRVLSLKYAMYEVVKTITASTRGRLRELTVFLSTVEGMNAQRKDKIERTLAEMLHTLRSIAWADDEKCSVIVQDKGTDINVSIVANLRAILDLIGRLHDREVSIQQKLMKSFAEAWDRIMDALVTALLEHLDKTMQSPAYMNPTERDELIHDCIADLVGRPVWEKIAAAAPASGSTSADVKSLVAHAAQVLCVASQAPNSAQPSRYNGASPGGFTGLLRSTLKSIMSLVGSLEPPKGGAASEHGWPVPGGTAQKGWLRDWEAVAEPTVESLQIAGVVDLAQREAERTKGTPETRIQDWQSAVEVFSTRLKAFSAEYMSRAIHREDELNIRARTDSEVLRRDLQAVLQFCTSFPYPQLLSDFGEVVLVDCLGATLTCSPSGGDGTPCIHYTRAPAEGDDSGASAPLALRLTRVDARRAGSQWGTVQVLEFWGTDGKGGEEVHVAHRFLGTASLNPSTAARLHRLCDSQQVAHNFPSPTLLEAHMQECDEVMEEAERYQARLQSYTDYETELKRLPEKEPSQADDGSAIDDPTADERAKTPEPLTAEEVHTWMLCNAGITSKWDEVRVQADKIAAPRLAALRSDSATFLTLLNHTLAVQSWLFTEHLLSRPNALIPTLRGAAAFLMKATSTLGGLIDAHQQEYMITDLDFCDQHDRQEVQYATLLKQLCEAPNQHATTEVFKSALQVLQDIEVAYCDVKTDKEQCLKKFMADLDAAIASLTKEIYTLLKIDDAAAPILQGDTDADNADAPPPANCAVIASPGGAKLLEMGTLEQIALATLDTTARPEVPEPVDPFKEPEPVDEPPPPVDPKAKGAKNAPPVEEAKNPEKEAEEERMAQLRKSKARIEAHVVPLQQDVFCLEASNGVVLQALRGVLVDWLGGYSASLRANAAAKVEKEMLTLEQWLSEKLRLHQRRMPSLASQEYDTRMRAIMENEELRHREFSWIGKRMTNSMDMVRVELENQQSAFDKELKGMAMRMEKLPQTNNFAALGVHKKTQEQQYTAIGSRVRTSLKSIRDMVEKAEKTMQKDGRRFLEEHCRTFSEGGVMSEDQIAQAKSTIEEMQARAKSNVEDLKKDLTRVAKEQAARIEAERKEYQTAYEHNLEDLTFLDALSQAVGVVKGGVNVIIGGSLEAERRIEGAVADLEQRVKTLTNKVNPAAHTTNTATLREDIKPASAQYFQSDVDFTDPADGGTGSGTELTGTVNAYLSDMLRKAKIRRDAVLRNTAATHLIQALDNTALLLYHRGHYLGLVEKQLAFHPLSPFNYFTEKDASEGQVPKAATPAAAVLDQLVETFWATASEVLKKYYEAVKARGITRPDVISGTEAEHKEMLSARIDIIKALLSTHFDAAHPEYSKQVGRIHLLAPRVPNEVFVGLYNNAFASIAETSGAVKQLLDEVYSRLAQLRNQHRVMVKQCMTNPGNRVIIEKTSAAEARRHKQAVGDLRLFHGVLLREEVNMAKLITTQILSGTDTLFKVLSALVIPDMIVKKSDVVVGNHRSLKRLRLAKQRSAADKEPQTAPAAEAAKPNPKAAKGKGAPDAGKAPVDADRPSVSYNGLTLEPRKAFSDFKAAHPGVDVPEHLAEPKAADDKALEEPDPKAGKAAAKAAPKKGGKPAAAAAAATPEIPDDAAGTSPAVDGPDEAMFKVAIQCRNQTSAAFYRYHAAQVQRIDTFFNDVVASEQRWFKSWNTLVQSLLPNGDE